MKYYVSKNCLLCQGDIKLILSLGATPLANEFLSVKKIQDIYPLNLMQCQKCQHIQLDTIVDREVIFKNYLYVSGTSTVNVKHFKDYAESIIKKFNLTSSDTICEIASNDGCFLKNFKEHNIKIIGIDPALNIAEQANKEEIFTIPEFFTEELANTINQKYGKCKVIVCNNMLAHNDNVCDIIKGVVKLLSPTGSFVFENSYLLDILNKTLLDLVYHEHIHHFHLTPLIKFFDQFNIEIYHVERLPNHGGSIRVFTAFKNQYAIDNSVYQLLQLEKDIDNKLQSFSNNIKNLKDNLNVLLNNFNKNNKKIAIYGMPAKATTLMYALNIDERLIDFAIDDNLLKQNTFSPGKHLPIYDNSAIEKFKPDVILILAWNFAESIMEKIKFNGTWIIPLPTLKVI